MNNPAFRIVWFALVIAFWRGAWAEPVGSPATVPELRVISGRTMGTTYAVKYVDRGGSAITLNQVEADVDATLERLNRQMSTYLVDSDLSRFNRSRATNWFAVPLEMAEVFGQARVISEKSRGAFDITVAPLVDLWGFGAEKRPWQVPEAAQIQSLAPRVDFKKVDVRTEPPAIRKEIPEMACDLSAIAKGYAVDKLAEHLERAGLVNYLVEIGGEVRARGRNVEDSFWRVGIRHPSRFERLFRAVSLRDMALATSGDYAQSFEKDGRLYSHTIDPRTGWPIHHSLTSVTVAHASCASADAWATAINVLGPDEGYNLAVQERLPVLMIFRTADGLMEKMTPGFAAMIVER